jgi:hypothetical protein
MDFILYGPHKMTSTVADYGDGHVVRNDGPPHVRGRLIENPKPGTNGELADGEVGEMALPAESMIMSEAPDILRPFIDFINGTGNAAEKLREETGFLSLPKEPRGLISFYRGKDSEGNCLWNPYADVKGESMHMRADRRSGTILVVDATDEAEIGKLMADAIPY